MASDQKPDSAGFVLAVQQHIAPVLSAYGFCCTEIMTDESCQYGATFASSKVELTIYRDPLRREIHLTLKHNELPSEGCSLQDVMKAQGLEQWRVDSIYVMFSSRDAKESQYRVKQIAAALAEHGASALRGEMATWQRMVKANRDRNDAYYGRHERKFELPSTGWQGIISRLRGMIRYMAGS